MMIVDLVNKLERSQWEFHHDNIFKNYPILTRDDLRRLPLGRGPLARSSGSTGEPVAVAKTPADILWSIASSIREIRWRRWDTSKDIAIVNARSTDAIYNSWLFPREIFPIQGRMVSGRLRKLSEIQTWLEDVDPHYLYSYPSIIRELDLSKLPRYIDNKSTGERGGDCYSAEECGTIALRCPDHTNNYHVMENILVELDNDGTALISSTTNPIIKRYKIGDVISLGSCDCGRSLQTITDIKGRIRNMISYPDGSKSWPTVGGPMMYELFGITKFQIVQKTLTKLILYVNIDKRLDEIAIKKYVNEKLMCTFDIEVVYNSFINYGKFEEFRNEISKE